MMGGDPLKAPPTFPGLGSSEQEREREAAAEAEESRRNCLIERMAASQLNFKEWVLNKKVAV